VPSRPPFERCWVPGSDSDILFMRRYGGLFTPPAVQGRPVFMTDVGHAYAVRPWKLLPAGPVRLAGRVNTGVMLTPPDYLDLPFLEWLLGGSPRTPCSSAAGTGRSKLAGQPWPPERGRTCSTRAGW
jgi:hypothetical protein